MSQKNSDIIHSSASIAMNLFRKGLMHGAGYNTERLKERPLIANSHSEMTTGHSHLNRLAEKVKEGIIAARGECAEFNVPAPCNCIAMAHDGMRFVLAQRDLIAFVEDGLACARQNPGYYLSASAPSARQ